MSIKIEESQEVSLKDDLSAKSILYIDCTKSNNLNIENFKKRFKLFESSLDSEYIVKNISKYDIIFYIDNKKFEILHEIRKINTQIPIIISTNNGNGYYF
jgi:hypothetical protein